MGKAKDELLGKIRNICGDCVVSDNSRIYHDLSISGDDAHELFDFISNKFEVNLSSMNFDSFFPDETEALLEHILGFFKIPNKKIPITVAHLLLIIDIGCWVDPVVE